MSDTITRTDDARGAPPPPSRPAPPAAPETKPDLSRATTLYILYLVGFVSSGLTTIIGLILAYVWRGEAGDALASHCTNAIHVFWKGLLYLAPFYLLFFGYTFWWMFEVAAMEAAGPVSDAEMMGTMGTFFGVMALVMIVALVQAVWFVVRCAKGIGNASSGLPYPNPRSWGF